MNKYGATAIICVSLVFAFTVKSCTDYELEELKSESSWKEACVKSGFILRKTWNNKYECLKE